MTDTLYHIGRDKHTNEIYISNQTVSSVHAQLIIDENENLVIIDLSSKNGVLVNGTKIPSPFKLSQNDIISIGGFKCTYSDIVNSIKVFDFKNNPKVEKSVPLQSSINKLVSKRSFAFKINKKSVFTSLIVISLITIIIGATFVNDQKSIKQKFNNLKENKELSTNEISKSEKQLFAQIKKQKIDVIYDFSCLNVDGDAGTNQIVYDFGEFTRITQNIILNDIQVTIKEEKEEGDALIESFKDEYTFNNNGSEFKKLKRIMNDIVVRLAKPRGIDYEMHYVDDDTENVVTLGGHIIFFKGMYDFCNSDSELAAIISHEIAHNELGHSTLDIKKRKAANSFGILGQISLIVEGILTTSFNQKQEAEADLFGVDLVYPTYYKSCDAIKLWERMSQSKGEFNPVSNLISSHPFSKTRSTCLQRHLKSNYNKTCNN